jgi:hypothetical protein
MSIRSQTSTKPSMPFSSFAPMRGGLLRYKFHDSKYSDSMGG